MSDLYSDISEMKELSDTLSKEVRCINEKFRAGDGKITPADAEYLNNITHSMKSVQAGIEAMEKRLMREGGRDDGYGYNDGHMEWYRGEPSHSYNRDGYDRMTYGARGRGSSANRDSMGRYRDGDVLTDLRNAMDKAPSDRARRALSEAIQEMEQHHS